MDTVNTFMVGGWGDNILIGRLGIAVTREEAINLAAWLATVTDIAQVVLLVQEIEET